MAPTRKLALVAWGVLSCLAGCGSDGGGSPAGTGGAGGTQTAVGTMSWTDDGVRHTTSFASGAFVASAMMDLWQISGGTSSGLGVAMGVGVTPPLVAGTYVCAQNGMRPIVSFSYTTTGLEPLASACTIDIATIGVTSGTRATGTFSATFPLTAGGTKAIANGAFNLMVVAATLP